MAGFLSMLPNLVSGGGGGILSSLKNAAASVLGDVGSGKVSSWGDFGKSLARAGSNLLGGGGGDRSLPVQDTSNADYVNRRVLDMGKNAANETTVIQQSKDMQPKGVEITPTSMAPYKAPAAAPYKPLDVAGQSAIGQAPMAMSAIDQAPRPAFKKHKKKKKSKFNFK